MFCPLYLSYNKYSQPFHSCQERPCQYPDSSYAYLFRSASSFRPLWEDIPDPVQTRLPFPLRLSFLSGIHDQFMSIGISCALYLLHVFPFSKKPSEAFLSLLEQYMKLIPAVEPVLNPISQQTILPACRYWSVLTDFYFLFFTIS